MEKEIKDIIRTLKNEIALEEKLKTNANETSWSYQLGILISVNDAKIIVNELTNKYNEKN